MSRINDNKLPVGADLISDDQPMADKLASLPHDSYDSEYEQMTDRKNAARRQYWKHRGGRRNKREKRRRRMKRRKRPRREVKPHAEVEPSVIYIEKVHHKNVIVDFCSHHKFWWEDPLVTEKPPENYKYNHRNARYGNHFPQLLRTHIYDAAWFRVKKEEMEKYRKRMWDMQQVRLRFIIGSEPQTSRSQEAIQEEQSPDIDSTATQPGSASSDSKSDWEAVGKNDGPALFDTNTVSIKAEGKNKATIVDLPPSPKDVTTSSDTKSVFKKVRWEDKTTDVAPPPSKKDVAASSDTIHVSPQVAERNKLAHAASSSSKVDFGADKKLAALLASVGAVETFAAGMERSAEIDEWLGHLENLVILGYQIGTSTSFTDIFMSVAAYAKMNSKRSSIIMDLYAIINDITSAEEKDDKNDVEPHAWKDWTGQDVVLKWELFKTNTVFTKISYLITAAMSLTVCTTKKIEWSPFGLRLVSLEAAKEQLKAVDVLDALVKTFVWMCDTGWKCFETRSITPILYSDVKIQQYNEDCDYVLANAESAIAGNIEDLGAYENKLNSVYKQTCTMKAAKSDGSTSIWLQRKYADLVSVLEKLAAKRRNTDIRFSPIGFSLHGPTSVGKTTLGKLTMSQSLAAMGFLKGQEVDESRILTMDMFDKYNSTWTSDILGVFMDDLGNTKSDFQKDNPHTSVIIKFFNNVAAQAIKAELNAKGVVFIDFKCGIVTTNVKDLAARQYSNCPESILRRFYHVSVNVRDKYRKQNSTMLNKRHPDLKNSQSLVSGEGVWRLTVEEIETFETVDGISDYRFRVMKVRMDDGRTIECKDILLKDYLDVIIQLSKEHKDEQDSLIQKSKSTAKASFCSRCCRFPEFCGCPPEEITIPKDSVVPHSLVGSALFSVLTGGVKEGVDRYIQTWMRPINFWETMMGYSPVRTMTTRALAKSVEEQLNTTGTPLLIAITPSWLYRTAMYQKTLTAFHSATAYYDTRRPMTYLGLGCLSAFGYGLFKRSKKICITASVLSMFSMGLSAMLYKSRVKQIADQYVERRDALPEYAKTIRDGSFPKTILFAATLALGVKLISMWNDHRLKTDPQSLTPADIDAQPSWFGYMMKKIGISSESSVRGAIPEQVLKTGKKNQGWCHFTRSDGSETGCNIVYPEKGYVWFPLHIFHPRSDMNVEPVQYVRGEVFRSEDKKTSKFKFVAELGFNAVSIEGLDMVECFVERCPDICENLKKFLPLSPIVGVSVSTIMIRDKDAKLSFEKLTVDHGIYGHKFLKMSGGCYTTRRATTGACMAMLVTEGKQPVVAGFHIGGCADKKYGVMMTVTQPQAMQLRNKLLALSGIRGISSATELPDTQYGKRVLASNTVHPNAHFIRNLDEEAAIDVLGSTTLRSECRSKIIPSPLQADVEKEFGIVNKWGPPKLRPNWKAFNATLEHIIDPAEMFVPSLLQRARQDWLKPIKTFTMELLRTEEVRPLEFKEIIMGVPGKRFLDAIPMNTSIGFPLFGAKKKKFTYVVGDDGLENRIPDDDIMREYQRCLTAWEKGERAYPVVAATLKDQPTEIGCEKVRVFQALAVALGFGIRRWFLPIARVLSLCPELSESAVGVNAFSQQWDALMLHAEKFADDGRVIAWDYSKYDVRMNSQMTYAALQSMIDLAELCNYSDYDLRMMNALVADVIHPLIDYNGTMIMVYNINTSGNNITVNINSIANSLYARMGFFAHCPEVRDFRSCVAAMTYGDDFKGSVKQIYRSRFNFSAFKDFLAQHGMKVTEPDKKEGNHEDLHVDDVDFLKRKSCYIPEIGTRIGALSKDSMLKCLLSNLESTTETRELVAIACVESYMHELFAHGRREYENDQPKILAVCERSLNYVPPAVQFTFDDRVSQWRQKYLGEEPPTHL